MKEMLYAVQCLKSNEDSILVVVTSRTWFELNDVIFQIARQYISFHPMEHLVQGLNGSQELTSSCQETGHCLHSFFIPLSLILVPHWGNKKTI